MSYAPDYFGLREFDADDRLVRTRLVSRDIYHEYYDINPFFVDVDDTPEQNLVETNRNVRCEFFDDEIASPNAHTTETLDELLNTFFYARLPQSVREQFNNWEQLTTLAKQFIIVDFTGVDMVYVGYDDEGDPVFSTHELLHLNDSHVIGIIYPRESLDTTDKEAIERQHEMNRRYIREYSAFVNDHVYRVSLYTGDHIDDADVFVCATHPRDLERELSAVLNPEHHYELVSLSDAEIDALI